jgi:integrase
MPTVNFYLKKPEPTTGKSLLYLQFKYSGYKLVFSFGQTINRKIWNTARQAVKNNQQTTADGQFVLNDLLENLKQVCLYAYHHELKNGIPTTAVIKGHLIAFMKKNHKPQDVITFFHLIQRFINNEIKYQGRDKSPSTLKVYKTVSNHLKAFEIAERYPVTFDSITLDFYYKYVAYLKGKGLRQNTIAKHIQMIKVFMSEALDLGYTTNQNFRHKKFSATKQSTDAVFLNEREIATLYAYDFSQNKRLEQVRDLFVFGCCVGLRFSDFSNIKAENIQKTEEGTYLRLLTKKTGELVVIPLSPIVLQLFAKYNQNANKLPKALSNQKFNDYIKEVCLQVGFTQKGRLATEPQKELWQCVSSHTARRSFATNFYLQNFPPLDIMKITGHRTEKAFLTYIKVTKDDAARKLNKHINAMWKQQAVA